MRTRRSFQFRPQCDGLESKALLSTVSLGPVARVPAVVAPTQNHNGNGDVVERDHFRLRGSDTDYELKVRSGQYRFSHDYEMEISRDRGRNATFNDGFGLTAVDAMDVFFSRMNARLGLVQPTQNGSGDYAIDRERFTQRGGRTYYELTIRSGGYKFEQSYELKLHRVNNGPNTGLRAVEAIDDFQFRLFNRVFAAIGGNNGGGNGGNNGGDDGGSNGGGLFRAARRA